MSSPGIFLIHSASSINNIWNPVEPSAPSKRRAAKAQVRALGQQGSATSASSMETTAEKGGGGRVTMNRIVVCGGGIIGACAAYFLSTGGEERSAASKGASSPVHVTVVERSSIACAASGKAGGFLALDWCDGGPLSTLARKSFLLHRDLSAALDGPSSYGYRPLHTLSLSLDSDGSGGRRTGASLPPWIDGSARTPRTIGTPETTAQVHPRLLTRKLLSAAAEKGRVEVVVGELERVVVEGGRAEGVVVVLGSEEEGSAGRRRVTLPADAVVLALGPWSAHSPLVSSLLRVSGLKAHSIVLRPRNPATITPHALFLSYTPSGSGTNKPLDPEVYPRPTGEVYICGMSKEEDVPDDPQQVAADAESIAMLHKIAGAVSSHLVAGEEAEVLAEQACFLPCTDDGLPVIGEIPGVGCCYVATGHGCWGILNGPATGAALAELILDGHATTVNLTPFSPARFLHHGRSKIV